MAGRLENKVVLITGGSRGMGEAEARLFHSEGATVVITDVRDPEGSAVANHIDPSGQRCRYVHLDVTSEPAWDSVIAEVTGMFGRIDVLVNNAGIFGLDSLFRTTVETYMRMVEVNQLGVFLGMKMVGKVMAGQNSGSIVNISSVAGLTGSRGNFAYSATKWAVRGMTKSAALDLARFNVRVNSIHPGLVDTPMLASIDEYRSGARAEMAAVNPFGREAEPIEVARMALFLASDESSFSTGAEFVIDGGYSAQ